MRIANWRKLWGSVNWETVENCWELWKLVRIVGTCRVGWIKKRKQWSIYFQPLWVHTGRFLVFIILWQPLSFFSLSPSTPLNIDIHEFLFVCWGATWCVGDFGNQRNLCLIYSHIRVVRTIWIRTYADTRRYTGTNAHTCTYEPSSSRMDATHLSVDGAQVTKWVPGRTSHLADDCPCICASIQICISVLPLPCIWSARSSKWSHREIESAVEHTWSWWNFLLPVACDSCDPQIEFYINFIFNISLK